MRMSSATFPIMRSIIHYTVVPPSPLYRKYNLGTTVFSALAGGILTGKVRSSTYVYSYV